MGSPDTMSWVEVVCVDDLATLGKMVADLGATQVLVLWNDGNPVAMADTCIHQQRSLSKGVVFNGRLVCAGHQWSFDLNTGFCKERDRYQPTFPTKVVDGMVFVNIDNHNLSEK